MINRRVTKIKALFIFCAANLVFVIAVMKYYEFVAIPKPKLQRPHSRRALDVNQERCTPKRNIVFLKTHKTGSSTVSNILHRYGDRNNLAFALPKGAENRLGWPWFFQSDHMTRYNVTPNILCSHARYNKDVMRKLMPNDTFYVTILRDPVTQFESTFSYMNFGELLGISNTSDSLYAFLEKPKDILVNYVLTKDLTFFSNRVKLIRNGMFYDLGLEAKDFERQDRIVDAIQELDSQFHLVMLMEHFDESLVLLRRLLCWEEEDILYFHLNQRQESHRRTEYPRDLIYKIRNWSSADVLLYEHFKNTLLGKLSNQPEDFFREVESLRYKNYYLKHMCLDSESSEQGHFRAETKGFTLRRNITTALRNTCDRMTWSEVRYLNFLKKKQAAMFKRNWWTRFLSNLLSGLW